MSGIEHKVYDPEDQIENGLVVIENWRDSRIGDWVKACLLYTSDAADE